MSDVCPLFKERVGSGVVPLQAAEPLCSVKGPVKLNGKTSASGGPICKIIHRKAIKSQGTGEHQAWFVMNHDSFSSCSVAALYNIDKTHSNGVFRYPSQIRKFFYLRRLTMLHTNDLSSTLFEVNCVIILLHLPAPTLIVWKVINV